MPEYRSQAARDAANSHHYSTTYAEYLDRHAAELADYWQAHGDAERADAMITRSLSEALAGNDGA